MIAIEDPFIVQKKLLIAHHEAGHTVMALICRQRVLKVSLKEMDSLRGTDKYLGHTKLEPFEQTETLTINEAIRRVMISLGGYSSEVFYLDGSIKIGCDDLTFAIKRAEYLMQSADFRNWASKLPIPGPGAMDVIEDLAPWNKKRILRVMQINKLTLQKSVSPRPKRPHLGQVITIKSNVRY